MRRVSPSLYTKEYFLEDCTGYEEFKRSWGKTLEPRLKRIVKEIPLKKGMEVLDVGCGRGELVFWAARRGAKRVVGIDYSRDAVKLAREAHKSYSPKIRKKTEFKIMDAKSLKFEDEAFDCVFLSEVIEHLYLEEQDKVFAEISRILKKNGFVFVHTAPSRWFNDYTYRFWCYPISTLLISLWKVLTGKTYPNLAPRDKLRTKSHKVMHVNEPDYFSLRRLFKTYGFTGAIRSTNVTVLKPILSWKDNIFNAFVYLSPLSNYPPFNIFWGNDFITVLKKK